MGKAYEITKEEAKAIRQAMEKKENKKYYKRMLAVALRGEGKDNTEIGSITGYHPKKVSQLVSKYAKEGMSSLTNDGRKGGNNRNMSQEEAERFLEQFAEQASKGKLTTVEEIAVAYDEATGKQHKSLSTVYYFLHSHGYKRIMPRKQHPGKANDEETEASKKLN